MAARSQPNPRRRLGVIFVAVGIGVWLVGGALFLGNVTGLLATIPYAGFVTTSVGAILEAVGVSFLRGSPVLGQLEKRRTSLVVVIPALLLFTLMLLGAALWFGENLEQPTTAGRWIGSTALLLFSTLIVSALFRDVVLRFDERGTRGGHQEPHKATSGRPRERDHVASSWRFTPRWKEELVCASPDGELLLEMMTHEPHVYFPTDEAWDRQAPPWVKNRRAELLAELEQWCVAEGIPLTVDEKAWVAAPGGWPRTS